MSRIKYEITRWRDGLDEKAIDRSVCHQSPRARQELWRMIYEMVEAEALLDRPCALRLAAQFDNFDTSRPKQGYYRTQTFRLREGNGLVGAFVEFRAWRD